mmetsp:Transcript_39855/g.84941  ORF Transcript_39855/g.84941 Transcript_39855/m.84941 type:complete len:213 (+) Transcript_39855:81-719(+)
MAETGPFGRNVPEIGKTGSLDCSVPRLAEGDFVSDEGRFSLEGEVDRLVDIFFVGAAARVDKPVGAAEELGANDKGDLVHNGLASFRSKHSHCAGEREKSQIPRPAQLAGHNESGHNCSNEGQVTAVPLGNCRISPAWEHLMLSPSTTTTTVPASSHLTSKHKGLVPLACSMHLECSPKTSPFFCTQAPLRLESVQSKAGVSSPNSNRKTVV